MIVRALSAGLHRHRGITAADAAVVSGPGGSRARSGGEQHPRHYTSATQDAAHSAAEGVHVPPQLIGAHRASLAYWSKTKTHGAPATNGVMVEE
jgi:hypothetical protein